MPKCDIINMTNANKVRNQALETIDTELNNGLDKLIEILKLRIEKEVLDVGYFRDIVVKFSKEEKPKDLFAKNVALIVKQDTKNQGKAYLSVAALHPYMLLDGNIPMANGNREELLEYMSKSNTKQEILNAIKQLDDGLRQK